MDSTTAIAAETTLGRLGRALADPSRQRILLALLDGAHHPSDLADVMGLGRSNVSNHLTCLRECGLVVAAAEGRRVRYELASPELADALRQLVAVELVPLSECCETRP
jgi:DNA-binding transcriptional ArsR family regulator